MEIDKKLNKRKGNMTDEDSLQNHKTETRPKSCYYING